MVDEIKDIVGTCRCGSKVTIQTLFRNGRAMKQKNYRKEGDIIYECKNCGHKHIQKKQFVKENNRLNELNLKNQTRMGNY